MSRSTKGKQRCGFICISYIEKIQSLISSCRTVQKLFKGRSSTAERDGIEVSEDKNELVRVSYL